MVSPFAQLIPQIWANAIKADIEQSLAYYRHYAEQERKEHEKRMAEDPDYAKHYAMHQAENEAESYWIALYENQLQESEEDEDEW